jgi:hypothetical protein
MGGDALTALAEARAAGLEVRAEPGRLVVRGPRSGAELARCLLDRTAEVLTLLAAEDAEVAWRVVAMRPQVPSRGPIPVLVARDAPPVTGSCISCGDPLVASRATRCVPCARAVWLVLHDVREGVGP